MKKGSVFGGILLIAGSCIGVGMLGLPIVTGLSGLIPTIFMTLVAFVFMTTTALYLYQRSPVMATASTTISIYRHLY